MYVETLLIQAMTLVDRAQYVRPAERALAYQDAPQSIGCHATISAPHMHAHVAELLLPYIRSDSSVLDVGSGSGYLLSLFHHLIPHRDLDARIVGIEHISELLAMSIENMKRDGLASELESKRIVAIKGDGRHGL